MNNKDDFISAQENAKLFLFADILGVAIHFYKLMGLVRAYRGTRRRALKLTTTK